MHTWIKILLMVAITTITLFMLVRIIKGYTARREAVARIQTLPEAIFPSLYGGMVKLTEYDRSKPVVIKYFHPECDYCRYEAREIAANAPGFSKLQLVMVTPDDSLQRVKQFIVGHNLLEVDNIEILIDRNNQFRNVFGRAILPSAYIYGPGHTLVKQFMGEASPDAILYLIQNMEKKNTDNHFLNNH